MRTPHPAANVYRLNDKDSTDIIFFDTPAIDGGQTCAQVFTGRHSKFTSVHPIIDTSAASILGAFQDCIRWHGAPEELGADNAEVYNNSKFFQYYLDLYIRLWQLESYH